jgi:hypothetical protein
LHVSGGSDASAAAASCRARSRFPKYASRSAPLPASWQPALSNCCVAPTPQHAETVLALWTSARRMPGHRPGMQSSGSRSRVGSGTLRLEKAIMTILNVQRWPVQSNRPCYRPFAHHRPIPWSPVLRPECGVPSRRQVSNAVPPRITQEHTLFSASACRR